LGYILFGTGTLLCTVAGVESVVDCFGTAPVSGPGTLAAPANGFEVTLPAMEGELH
jgi:hypothetical protein